MNNVAISIRRKFSALVAAAFVGLAVYVGTVYVSDWLIAIVVFAIHGVWPGNPAFELVILQLLFGWIVALPASLVVGLPIWTLADRYLPRDRRTAMWLGAAVGTIIGCLLLAGQGIPIFGNFSNDAYPTGWWGLAPDGQAHRVWAGAMAAIGVCRFAVAGIFAARVGRRGALR